ncbi:MAG: right-handed parallel beta-helix repeat-containing protein, partial [Bacteroidota bacterium]
MGKPLQHALLLKTFSHKPVNPLYSFLLILMTVASCFSVQATNYYVSPNGNDSNAGTAAQPFRTLEHGINQLAPGDSLKLMAGTYREGEIYINNGGTSNLPVVIQGAGPRQTFIKGSEVVSGWTQHSGNIWRTSWTTNSQQVFADGQHLQQIGNKSDWHNTYLEPVGSGLGDMTPGSFFFDGGSNTLYVQLSNGGNPNNVLMEASVKNFLLDGENRSSYVTFCDLTLAHSNGTHDGGRGYLLKTGPKGWVLENMTMEYGDFMCVNLVGVEHLMKNCTIQYGGDVGLDMNNSDSAHGWAWYEGSPRMNTVVEGCLFTKNNYRNFDFWWHGGAMKLIPAIKGLTVRGNRVEDNNGPGIWFDHAVGENIITDNLCIGNAIGIFYEIQPNVTSTDFGAVICNNRVIRSEYQGIYVSASSNVVVQHNTLYHCWAGIVVHGMPRGDFDLYNNVIKKNVLFGTDIGDLIQFEGTDAGNNQVDSNFYVTGLPLPNGSIKNNPRIGVVNGGGYNINYTSLSDLRSNTNYGEGALSGDPMWTDPEAYDFTKDANSPAAG